VLDALVATLDQALAFADSRARQDVSLRLVDRAKAEVDSGRLLDEIVDVLADPNIPDEQAGRVVRLRVGCSASSPPAGLGLRGHFATLRTGRGGRFAAADSLRRILSRGQPVTSIAWSRI